MNQPDQFDAVWAVLPHPEGTVIRWLAQNKDRTRRIGDFARSPRDLRIAAATLPDFNFYVAPNPASKLNGTRHSTGDVTHWSWFFLDVDPDDDANADPVRALQELLTMFENHVEMHLRPVIIDSGRGQQAWFHLGEQKLDGVDGRWIATRTMGYWLDRLATQFGKRYGCKVDTSVRDLPRLMRCPGTINQRTKRKASVVNPGNWFANQHFLRTFLLENVPAEEYEKPDIEMVAPGTPWQNVVMRLTPKARQFVSSGWEHPGRHDAAWHTARCLAERGVSKEQAYLAVEWGNQFCTVAGQPKPLSPKDIRHAVESAYGS